MTLDVNQLRCRNTLFCKYLLASAVAIGITGFVALNVPVTYAQAVANAKMHGIVTDATGAVVPNATVIATQTESGRTATAKSSDSGEYTLPDLPVVRTP